jgi:hypothetical protein
LPILLRCSFTDLYNISCSRSAREAFGIVDDSHKTIRASLLNNVGQIHLIALGCVIQVERALMIVDNSSVYHKISFLEHHENIARAPITLREDVVEISIEN